MRTCPLEDGIWAFEGEEAKVRSPDDGDTFALETAVIRINAALLNFMMFVCSCLFVCILYYYADMMI